MVSTSLKIKKESKNKTNKIRKPTNIKKIFHQNNLTIYAVIIQIRIIPLKKRLKIFLKK